MSRLIDAGLLLDNLSGRLESMKDYDAIKDVVKNMPTAYDLDKVVDQLNGKIKELKDISCCIVLDKERKAQNRGYYAAMNHAIEIVKGGGVNE